MRCRPEAFNASGGGSPASCGSADGAKGRQPPSASGINCPPCQGLWLDALRPAWANWMPIGMAECRRTMASTVRSAASLSSDHRPRQPGVMRPSRVTAVASMVNKPAPDSASPPRWIKCQSLAQPSSAEYWHIGAMTMRLASGSGPRWKGENRALKAGLQWVDWVTKMA